MRIRDRYTGGVRGSGVVRGRGKAGDTSQASRSGEPLVRVNLSGRSMDIQKARVVALQAPDIREGLVDEIQGQIQQGRYQVTGRDVVPNMIRDHLMGVAE